MGIPLEKIKDPALVKRIQDTMQGVSSLKLSIASECPKPKKKRIRQDTKPLMNKLEQEYFDKFLSHRCSLFITTQSIRFKLANGIWYKPDFCCDSAAFPQRVAIEVKGPHAFRGGFENLKVAAHQYPWIKWVLAWKENGEWKEQVVLP